MPHTQALEAGSPNVSGAPPLQDASVLVRMRAGAARAGSAMRDVRRSGRRPALPGTLGHPPPPIPHPVLPLPVMARAAQSSSMAEGSIEHE